MCKCPYSIHNTFYILDLIFPNQRIPGQLSYFKVFWFWIQNRYLNILYSLSNLLFLPFFIKWSLYEIIGFDTKLPRTFFLYSTSNPTLAKKKILQNESFILIIDLPYIGRRTQFSSVDRTMEIWSLYQLIWFDIKHPRSFFYIKYCLKMSCLIAST